MIKTIKSYVMIWYDRNRRGWLGHLLVSRNAWDDAFAGLGRGRSMFPRPLSYIHENTWILVRWYVDDASPFTVSPVDPPARYTTKSRASIRASRCLKYYLGRRYPQGPEASSSSESALSTASSMSWTLTVWLRYCRSRSFELAVKLEKLKFNSKFIEVMHCPTTCASTT